jgi:hypothetical protein
MNNKQKSGLVHSKPQGERCENNYSVKEKCPSRMKSVIGLRGLGVSLACKLAGNCDISSAGLPIAISV